MVGGGGSVPRILTGEDLHLAGTELTNLEDSLLIGAGGLLRDDAEGEGRHCKPDERVPCVTTLVHGEVAGYNR